MVRKRTKRIQSPGKCLSVSRMMENAPSRNMMLNMVKTAGMTLLNRCMTAWTSSVRSSSATSGFTEPLPVKHKV